MAHEIFGDRFVGKRQKAWHGIGEVFNDDPSASEAIQRAGLAYRVLAQPHVAVTPDGIAIPTDTVDLIREPVSDDDKWRYFGSASKDYTVIDNVELGEMLDPITKEWPVETVGALGKGERVFLTLSAGEFRVKNEPVQLYYFINDAKDGSGSANLHLTGVRVVCANTWRFAESEAKFSFALPHTKNVKEALSWHLGIMASMRKAQIAAMERTAAMGETKADRDVVASIINAAFPLPTKPQRVRMVDRAVSEDPDAEATRNAKIATQDIREAWERSVERAKDLRAKGVDLYMALGDSNPQIGGTVWAAFNAVTELSNWRGGEQSDETKQATDRAVVFGSRGEETERAYKAAMEFVTVDR